MGVTRKQKIKRDEDKSTSPAPYSSSGSPDTKSGKHNDRKKRKKTQYDYDICLPAHGKTYLAIGQDLYSIQEYLTEQQNASLHWYMRRTALDEPAYSRQSDGSDSSNHRSKYGMPVPNPDDAVPAALMVYTDIQTLGGLDRPVDYGTGIEYADGALRRAMARAVGSSRYDRPLDVGLQIGLWLNGTQGCRDILEGRLDDKVHHLVHYMGSTCPASKIFLRIGYEFDNPQFNYASDPQSYKDAFRYIADNCRKHKYCRRRVVMVWHSWAAGLPTAENNTVSTLDDFYPGDDVVDWVGISLFQQFYQNHGVGGTVQDLENVLNFAAKHRKPTMIAESTPFGWNFRNSYLSNLTASTSSNRSNAGKDVWNEWFAPALRLIQDYDISMWSYINCNWNAQQLWRGTGFGDTRLSLDTTIMDRWHDQVTSSRRFVRATDNKLCDNYRDSAYEKIYDKDYGRNSARDFDLFYDDDSNDGDSNDGDSHDDADDVFRDRHHSSQRHDRKTSHRDDDYFEGVGNLKKLWGEERADTTGNTWNMVSFFVFLSSSIAVVFFMYHSTRRKRVRRLCRNPKAHRVRFAMLDDKEDEGYQSIYGTIRCIEDAPSNSGERKFVRRVTSNLLLDNTSEGSTTVT